jgi:hypothetical protein
MMSILLELESKLDAWSDEISRTIYELLLILAPLVVLLLAVKSG